MYNSAPFSSPVAKTTGDFLSAVQAITTDPGDYKEYRSLAL